MKGKKLLLAVLLGLLCITLSACRCAPHEVLWRISEATFEKTFLNGQTVEVTVGNHAYYAVPDALYDGNTSIQFGKDGTVFFQPVDGEVLTGTYTYSHNGYQNTGFQIKFSDGSEVTDGVAGSYYGFSELKFTYQGASYVFTDHAFTTEEDHQVELDQIAYDLRNIDFTRGFLSATTTCGNDGKWQLAGEEISMNLYAEGFTLEAVQITETDEVIFLSDLKEGDCFVVLLYDYTVQPKAICGAILYYVDPLPQEPTVEDMTLKMEDHLPWLPEVLQNYENAQIRITFSTTNLPIGFTEYHQYLREPEEVRQYLEALNGMGLLPEEEAQDFTGGDKQYTVRVTVGEQTYAFCSKGDFLVIGEQLYQFMDGNRGVQLPDIDYSKAVQTFRTADETEVYNKDAYLYSATGFWQDLEFVIDTEEHNWTFAQETRRLVCDFGEVTVYDHTHFRYKGQNYVVAGEKNFSAFFE